MTRADRGAVKAALTFFGSAPVASALSLTIIGIAFLSLTIGRLIGPAGLGAMIATLSVCAAISLFARRDDLEWRGLLPISLMAFVSWCALSIIWSGYNWATLGGLYQLIGFGFLGVYIALVRDAIQIVRAVGDVLRVVLAASLLVELVVGVLLDSSFRMLGILGALGQGGPIQGLLGLRNHLGIVAVIAIVTFGIEWATRSVRRDLSIISVAAAIIVLALTRSPVASGVAVVTGVAVLALVGLRRVPATQRRYWQLGLLAVTSVVLALAWLFRFSIILLLNAGSEFEYRYYLWTQAFNLAEINPIQGWGWIGRWNTGIPPYAAISQAGPRSYTTALSAYVDVYLQVGIVGLALFLGLVGLALVRSWLLASDRRSVVYRWPALVLVVLVFASIFESILIADWGWLLFVVATVRASKELSWRQALR